MKGREKKLKSANFDHNSATSIMLYESVLLTVTKCNKNLSPFRCVEQHRRYSESEALSRGKIVLRENVS